MFFFANVSNKMSGFRRSGTGGSDPLENQKFRVYIVNNQLDPHGKSWTPPGNVGPPLEPLKLTKNIKNKKNPAFMSD